MKPAAFDYQAPADLSEVLELLAESGDDAKLLAGGQSLVPAMNFRLARPSLLIDLNGVPDLAYLHEENGELVIGAMTRQRQVERSPLVASRLPLLHETMPWIAHPQIRNRGTFGGSLAHADPAAELPSVVLALGGRFHLQSRSGDRWVDAEDFSQGLFETARQADEILLEVAIPYQLPGSGWAFEEMARRVGDFAMVGVGVVLELGAGGAIEKARIGLVSVADRPILAPRAAAMLIGEKPSDPLFRAAAATCAQEEIDPTDDLHATIDYRRHLTAVLVRRALERAAARAAA
jgi:aerobic carbon-monoxide dehydrogenase medium subunit